MNPRGDGPKNTNREKIMGRDIEKLFTQKVKVFSSVQFNRSSPLFALLKIVLKSLVENTRLQTLSARQEFHQLQVDVFKLRYEIGIFEFLSVEDNKIINFLLDEVISSGVERSVENYPSLANSELSKICSVQFSEVL